MPYFKTKDETNLFYKDWGNKIGRTVVWVHGWCINCDW